MYKVASFEITDLPLIEEISRTKKPVIISTGMSNLKEIDRAYNLMIKGGTKHIALLYCVSNYPSNINDFSLNNLEIIKKKFKVKIGLSDHTIGSFLSCMSIIKGAEVIEKHICLKNIKSVDSRFSLNENEIANFKKDLDNFYKLIKNNTYLRSKSEMKNKIFRRSIYAISDINPGEKFTKKNIKTFRPDKGLSASFFLKIINKKSPIKISKGKPLNKIGMKGQDTCELFFDNVRVPKENLLGMEGMGFMMLMKELAWERMLVAIICQAGAEAAFAHTVQYTKDRKAFGKPIGTFQNTRFKLAELRTEIDFCRTYLDRCMELQLEESLGVDAAAAAKYKISDMFSKVVDDCLQLHGGYGYMLEYPIARAYIDNRANRIYAGTNEIMKELISRTL